MFSDRSITENTEYVFHIQVAGETLSRLAYYLTRDAGPDCCDRTAGCMIYGYATLEHSE